MTLKRCMMWPKQSLLAVAINKAGLTQTMYIMCWRLFLSALVWIFVYRTHGLSLLLERQYTPPERQYTPL